MGRLSRCGVSFPGDIEVSSLGHETLTFSYLIRGDSTPTVPAPISLSHCNQSSCRPFPGLACLFGVSWHVACDSVVRRCDPGGSGFRRGTVS